MEFQGLNLKTDYRKKVLVVVDLMKALICRVNTSQTKSLRCKSKYCPDMPDYFLGAKIGSIYLRPYFEEFINFLFNNFRVGLWVNLPREKGVVLLKNLLEKKTSLLEFIIYDEEVKNLKHHPAVKKDVLVPEKWSFPEEKFRDTLHQSDIADHQQYDDILVTWDTAGKAHTDVNIENVNATSKNCLFSQETPNVTNHFNDFSESQSYEVSDVDEIASLQEEYTRLNINSSILPVSNNFTEHEKHKDTCADWDATEDEIAGQKREVQELKIVNSKILDHEKIKSILNLPFLYDYIIKKYKRKNEKLIIVSPSEKDVNSPPKNHISVSSFIVWDNMINPTEDSELISVKQQLEELI